jgi:hypothetical protein
MEKERRGKNIEIVREREETSVFERERNKAK